MENSSMMSTEALDDFTTIFPQEMSRAVRLTTASVVATTPARPCYPWAVPMCDPWISAAFYFVRYATYLAFAIGIPGSFFTIIILSRMKPFNSASVWLLTISCIDFFSLLLRFVVNMIFQTNPLPWVPWSCRFFYIMAETCEHATYYNLVALTVERFIAVWFPLKLAIWCSVKRAAAGAIFIFLFTMAGSLHIAETYYSTFGYCYIRSKYAEFWRETYQYRIQILVMTAFPMFAVILLNVLITFLLSKMKKIKQQMSDEKAKEKEKQQKQINRMLVAASVWFILSVLTELVYRLFESQFGPRYLEPGAIIPDRVRIVMLNVGTVLRTYNHAANFVLYIIAARKFRNELIRLLTCNKFVALGVRSTTSNSTKATTGN